jgi:DNA-binding NarL/FixJ family response regulator
MSQFLTGDAIASFASPFPEREGMRELLSRLREDLAALESATDARELSRTLLSALQLMLSGSVIAHAERPQPEAERAIRSESDWGLTARQRDVLALLIEGKSNKQICRELNLAEGTVKIHVSAILRALNVTNRTQVVLAVAKLRNSRNASGGSLC